MPRRLQHLKGAWRYLIDYPYILKKMRTFHYLVIVFLICQAARGDKLIGVQAIFRHGARKDFFLVGDEGGKEEERSKHSLGELTAQGKHMSFVLGKLLYQKYWKQLFQNTKYEKHFYSSLLEVWSTPTDRTIQSAQALLFGLLQSLEPETLEYKKLKFSVPYYLPSKPAEYKIGDNFSVFGRKGQYYHSVPIHTEPVLESSSFREIFINRISKIGGNFLTIHAQSNCPSQERWISQNLKKDEVKIILNSPPIQQFYKIVGKQMGYTINSTKQALKIVDKYHVSKTNGAAYPKLFQDPRNLNTGEFIRFCHNLLPFHTLAQRKATFTMFLQKLVSSMNKSIGDNYPGFFFYSTHETGLLNVLSALQMTSLKCLSDDFFNNTKNEDCVTEYPQFSASILFELWRRESDGHHYIKVLYNGKERKIPVCGNKVKCPLDQFVKWAEKFYEEDPWKVCGLPTIDVQ